jgi:hypothetical protein
MKPLEASIAAFDRPGAKSICLQFRRLICAWPFRDRWQPTVPVFLAEKIDRGSASFERLGRRLQYADQFTVVINHENPVGRIRRALN